MRHPHMSSLARPFVLFAMLLGITVTVTAPQAASAGDPSPFPMDVVVLTCDEDPGSVPQATIPDGCTGTDGAEVTVTDASDNEIGGCTTTSGSCVANIDLSGGATVTATLDSAAIPDGYEAIENPITLEVVNEFSGPTFVLVPEETTGLPNTGTGATQTHGIPVLPVLLTIGSVILVAIGFRSRRHAMR